MKIVLERRFAPGGGLLSRYYRAYETEAPLRFADVYWGAAEQGWNFVVGGSDMADKKPNALQTKLTPSSDLAAVVGNAPIARGEVVSKMWDYIKKNNLQNPQNKREILADAKLKPIFGGKDKVSMFEMNKHLAGHLKA
jgi:chromatin remodeling complex protein RSC6